MNSNANTISYLHKWVLIVLWFTMSYLEPQLFSTRIKYLDAIYLRSSSPVGHESRIVIN